MALLTLFMVVGLKWPHILTLYMLGWKGSCPRDSKNVSYVDVGLGLDLKLRVGGWSV